MVANKNKSENKLHKQLTGKGYRLKHGYELKICKTSKCGYKLTKKKN
jgi:hypothetical protein